MEKIVDYSINNQISMLDFQKLFKYLTEGLAVAVVAYYIPRRTVTLEEIAMIALTAAATFAVLDTFTPEVSENARMGAGFGIGYGLTGLEGFEGGQQAQQTQQTQQVQQVVQKPQQVEQQQDDDSTVDTDSDVTDTDSESDNDVQSGEHIPQGQEPSELQNYATLEQVGAGHIF